MQANKKLPRVLCFLVVCALFLTSCKIEEPVLEPQNIRIGICLYKQDDTFIGTILSYFEQEIRAHEQKTDQKITLKVLDAKGSQSQQKEQVERLIAQQYDVIYVNIVDRTAAAVLIDRAKSASIPIVFFNREPVEEDLQRWEHAYYVGAVASESGILQGQLVAELYEETPSLVDKNGDGRLQYVMLEGEHGHQDALLRTEFCVKAVTARGIKVEKLANETASWQRGAATTRVSQWIEQMGNTIEVVFANNDDMALGAIDAFKKAGLPLPFIVGVDATPPALEAVAEGTLFATVKNDAQGQANAMLLLGLSLSDRTGQTPRPKLDKDNSIRLPYKAVTRKNLSDELADS